MIVQLQSSSDKVIGSLGFKVEPVISRGVYNSTFFGVKKHHITPFILDLCNPTHPNTKTKRQLFGPPTKKYQSNTVQIHLIIWHWMSFGYIYSQYHFMAIFVATRPRFTRFQKRDLPRWYGPTVAVGRLRRLRLRRLRWWGRSRGWAGCGDYDGRGLLRPRPWDPVEDGGWGKIPGPKTTSVDGEWRLT